MIRLRKSPAGGGGGGGPGSEEAEELGTAEEELARCRREADFIGAVISALLGRHYVCQPEILRCDRQEIARLSEKIRPERPGKGLHTLFLPLGNDVYTMLCFARSHRLDFPVFFEICIYRISEGSRCCAAFSRGSWIPEVGFEKLADFFPNYQVGFSLL